MSKQQPPRKKIPQRTCVVCRKVDNKRALVRLVRTPEEGVQVDPSGKKNGRGAYMCNDVTCWQEHLHTDNPERAFQMALNTLEKALKTILTPEDRDRIRAAMFPMHDDKG
ncbi:MAG: YlxR family protein [Chloroflexi bacterium]|nr:YlxR family protein [Chloroflexota bacterium]